MLPKSTVDLSADFTIVERPDRTFRLHGDGTLAGRIDGLEAVKQAIARREKLLHIAPKGTDTLEARRFRVKARMNEQLPFTLPGLRAQLADLCGENGYTVAMDRGAYLLTVRVALTAKSNFDDVGGLLRRVAPANIVIDLELKYNQHGTLAGFTHARLAAYTHKELRNEVLT